MEGLEALGKLIADCTDGSSARRPLPSTAWCKMDECCRDMLERMEEGMEYRTLFEQVLEEEEGGLRDIIVKAGPEGLLGTMRDHDLSGLLACCDRLGCRVSYLFLLTLASRLAYDHHLLIFFEKDRHKAREMERSEVVQRDWKRVRDLLERVDLPELPRDQRVTTILINAYKSIGDTAGAGRAFNCLEQAAALDPTLHPNCICCKVLSTAYRISGELDKIEELLDKYYDQLGWQELTRIIKTSGMQRNMAIAEKVSPCREPRPIHPRTGSDPNWPSSHLQLF